MLTLGQPFIGQSTLGQALAAELPFPVPAPATYVPEAPPPLFPPSVLPALPFLPPGLVVTVGAGAEAANSFPGAKTYTGFPIPYFDWRKPGDPLPFHAPDDGFGIALLDFGMFRAGPVGRYVAQRDLSNGNANFVGLPNVATTIELGGFVEFWPTDFLRGRVEVRQGINGHNGLHGNIEADAVGLYGPWLLSLGPRAEFGNDQFMQSYFSVTPAEAAINGRVTPYAASGGLTSVGFLASAKYTFSPSWSVVGFAGYNRLVDSAAASPITNNLGSKNDFIGGAILEYSFSIGTP